MGEDQAHEQNKMGLDCLKMTTLAWTKVIMRILSPKRKHISKIQVEYYPHSIHMETPFRVKKNLLPKMHTRSANINMINSQQVVQACTCLFPKTNWSCFGTKKLVVPKQELLLLYWRVIFICSVRCSLDVKLGVWDSISAFSSCIRIMNFHHQYQIVVSCDVSASRQEPWLFDQWGLN